MQNREHIPVVFINILYIPGIIINLISIWKLDLKGIYWRSDDQISRVIKTNKEIDVLRVVKDFYIIITDL